VLRQNAPQSRAGVDQKERGSRWGWGVGNFQVKNAGFYAYLLQKTTCGQKLRPGGLNRLPGGLKTHEGVKILQGFQLPNPPSTRILPQSVQQIA